MQTENAPAIRDNVQLMAIEEYAMGPESILKQVKIIQDVMHQVMKRNEHYGVIPGTNRPCTDCGGKGCEKCGGTGDLAKPSLLKPGAEKLTMTFRLAPKFHVTERDLGKGHREYEVRTELFSIVTTAFIGEGVGSCSTMETKYRFRKADQRCPECGKETIIKGKKEYGGGWLCFKKKGGCGAKFEDGDPAIENQNMGRVEHDNPADYYNTCLKMAKKRSLVDATLTATAASDIFTQDVEDMEDLLNGNSDSAPNKGKPKKVEKLKTMKDLKSELAAKMKAKGLPKESQSALYAYVGPKDEKEAQAFLDNFDAKLHEFANKKEPEPEDPTTVHCPDDGEECTTESKKTCNRATGCPAWD